MRRTNLAGKKQMSDGGEIINEMENIWRNKQNGLIKTIIKINTEWLALKL